MEILAVLIPVSILLGGAGLGAFLWSLHARQYDDPKGDAARILSGAWDERPRPPPPTPADQNSEP
ncbi:cytochrome oxidase maturation protein, cbb3-type [Paracoccus isoporae]|uniref:Cytochrome oxidase maturation protein, cbb3-type n=1 Tax=Paracoccus isoporae TaxID=591205 RepID=A0A1G7BNG4_9RHOB|nr:cytochrome oxidase maturation protein, cbb3-type [Paracoccus isoporae]